MENNLLARFATKRVRNGSDVRNDSDWSSFPSSRPHAKSPPKVGDWGYAFSAAGCVCTGLKSSLFNLGGWIVSINNCRRVVSQSHKDQAAGIYDLHLELGVWHSCRHTRTHTRCQIVASRLWWRGLACRPICECCCSTGVYMMLAEWDCRAGVY